MHANPKARAAAPRPSRKPKARAPQPSRNRNYSLLALALSAFVVACASPEIVPLLGEDPEVGVLLGKSSDTDPRTSPMAAARRLHQALVQQDTETVWALLSEGTKKALDERGATIATSGRELIDESTLPGQGGTVRKVRFETIFFGPRLASLEAGPAQGSTAKIVAVSEEGTKTELEFVRDADGWKLEQTGF